MTERKRILVTGMNGRRMYDRGNRSRNRGQAMGRFYHDVHGTQVICLRIGTCHGSDDLADQRQRVFNYDPILAERPRRFSPAYKVF